MSTSLVIIGRQFGIYAGLSIFTFGIIGNLINLGVLFSTRSNPCLFLLFVSSIFNIIALSVGLLPRILNIGFGIDASSTSMIWCKSRYFLSYIATITSLTCICFASIDRYFVSCRSVTWRNWSKINTAKITVLITILIIIAINIPYLIFSTIIEITTSTNSTMTVCSLINYSLDSYIDYFVRPILIGILPAIILSVMGWLTYCNIMSIANVQRRGTFQRGLTSMILLQIITIVIPIAPFAIMNIYQTITSSIVKTSHRLAQETLIINISNIILYASYALNFYVYLISSLSYRREFLRFFLLFCHHQNHWNNRIEPIARK